MKLYLTVLLICISLVANDWLSLFHRFVGHLYTFLGEMSIQVLCPHFHGVVCLFVIEMCSLDIMDIRPFSDMWLANILFSQFGLSSPFWVRKLDFEIYYFSSTTFLESCHRGQDLIPKFSCQWPSFILPLVSPLDHMSTPSVGMASQAPCRGRFKSGKILIGKEDHNSGILPLVLAFLVLAIPSSFSSLLSEFLLSFPSSWSVTKLCPILCNPMDCSLLESSVHGISQARIREWVAISFSRGFSRPRDRTWVSCIVRRTEPPGKPYPSNFSLSPLSRSCQV